MEEQDWSKEEFIAYMKDNQLTEKERRDNELARKLNVVINSEILFAELLSFSEDPDRQQWQTHLNEEEWEMIKEVWKLLFGSKRKR